MGGHIVACVSDSLVDFWYDCIEGYLSGCLRPCGLDTFAGKVFVMKLEDLVERPVLLLHQLERLCRGRKTGVSEFNAIEEPLSDSNRNRRSILESLTRPGVSIENRRRIEALLLQHPNARMMLAKLQYPLPTAQRWEAPMVKPDESFEDETWLQAVHTHYALQAMNADHARAVLHNVGNFTNYLQIKFSRLQEKKKT